VLRVATLEAMHMGRGLPAAARAVSSRLAEIWPTRLLGAPPAVPVHLMGELTAGVTHLAARVPDMALAMAVAVVGAYLLARDLPELRRRVQRELPALLPRSSLGLGQVAWRATVRYLRAQILLATLTTVVTGVGLLLVRAPYALLGALCVGALDVAPALGPATILGPWALGAAMLGNYGLALRLALVLALAAAVRPTMEPRLVGGQIGLHPLAALVSMYVGLQLFGALGLAVGPVLTATAWAAYVGEAE